MSSLRRIDSVNRGLFVFLIDQSGSMNEPWGNSGVKKKKKTAQLVNEAIFEVTRKGYKGSAYKDRFDLICLGYGNGAKPAFAGGFSGQDMVSSNDIYSVYGITDEAPNYILESSDSGGTNMELAFAHVEKPIHDWIKQHPESAAPSIFHITDGENTGSDPTPVVKRIESMTTNYGNCLIWNLHISSLDSNRSDMFLENDSALTDENSKFLLGLSSKLPLWEELGENGGKYAFGYNLPADKLEKMLGIGTLQAV